MAKEVIEVAFTKDEGGRLLTYEWDARRLCWHKIKVALAEDLVRRKLAREVEFDRDRTVNI